MSIDIIIPTLDRHADLIHSIQGLQKQQMPDWRLLVVDQSRGAELKANRSVIASWQDHRITHQHRTERGLPQARNAGLTWVEAPVVLFLDDDVRITRPDFLQAHLDCYGDAHVGGVTGRIHERSVKPNAPTTTNRISRTGRVITNLEGEHPTTLETLKGANMSFRTEALRQVGGFDPLFGGTALLEDADASERVRLAGWSLRFEPGAALHHLSASTGGVRVEDALRTEHWRFHNTGYFICKNRGRRALPPVWATFSAIAAKRGLEWRLPTAPRILMAAMWQGVHRAMGVSPNL